MKKYATTFDSFLRTNTAFDPVATRSTQDYSPIQVGSLPDQLPVSKHVRMSSPVRVWPVLQEYVATELYVVVGADTVPFTGLSSAPQSTAAATKNRQLVGTYR